MRIQLFVAQGDNGIDVHGTRGWQIGSDDADGHEDDREKQRDGEIHRNEAEDVVRHGTADEER